MTDTSMLRKSVTLKGGTCRDSRPLGVGVVVHACSLMGKQAEGSSKKEKEEKEKWGGERDLLKVNNTRAVILKNQQKT